MWDGKSGEAITTLTSERLLGDAQADITAFSLDHQVQITVCIRKGKRVLRFVPRALLRRRKL